MNKARKNQTGLSLIEVALGMMILGLLMAGALSMYRVYQYQRGEEVTILHMDAVEEAIGTYVSRFQRYPVPMAFRLREGDADFGRAATMAGACNAAPPGDARACRASGVGGDVLIGNLPFQDLNLPYEMTLDGHGRRFTYAVSELMTQPNGNNPALQAVCVKKQEIDAAGNITERDCTAAADNPPQDIAIISHGRDGLGAWTAQGRPYVECGSSGTQMQNENCNNDGTLMLAQTTFAGATQNFNDDRMSVDILADSNYWQEMTEGILNRGEQFVGIGVDTPGRTLDVDGNVRAERVRTPQVCKRDGDDEADCFDPAVIAGDAGMRCGPTGFVKGIANSNVLCEPLMAAFSCPDDQVLVGITAEGAPECRDPALPGDDDEEPSSCAPTFQTQEIDCADGETGSISQRRDYTCNQAGEGSWGDWTETGRTCTAMGSVCRTYTVVVSNSANPTWEPRDVGVTCPAETYAEYETVPTTACVAGPAICAVDGNPGWREAVENTKDFNCRPLSGQPYRPAGECPGGDGSIEDPEEPTDPGTSICSLSEGIQPNAFIAQDCTNTEEGPLGCNYGTYYRGVCSGDTGGGECGPVPEGYQRDQCTVQGGGWRCCDGNGCRLFACTPFEGNQSNGNSCPGYQMLGCYDCCYAGCAAMLGATGDPAQCAATCQAACY